MSELSSQALERLTQQIVAAGIPEDRASDLAILNISAPIVEEGQWIILDEAGNQVAAVPAPEGWSDSSND